MAQADRVTNAIRASITGAGAKQSTKHVARTSSTAVFYHPIRWTPHAPRAWSPPNPGVPLLPFVRNDRPPPERGRDFGREGRMSRTPKATDRCSYIGGSDARIIMGEDEAALLRLWREKRGEVEPEDLSGNLIVQLGLATEDLNRLWYEANTGQAITDIQRQVQHPTVRWMGATLDGRVEATGAVFEAKFMLPWSFSEEAAAEKYMAQLQHNMWVVASRAAVLSVITGGGKWVEITTHADPLYQYLILTAERKFWRCVESGEPLYLGSSRRNHASRRFGLSI